MKKLRKTTGVTMTCDRCSAEEYGTREGSLDDLTIARWRDFPGVFGPVKHLCPCCSVALDKWFESPRNRRRLAQARREKRSANV